MAAVRKTIDVSAAMYGPRPPRKVVLEVIDRGAGQSAAILLLPGLWATAESFAGLVDSLGQERRVVALSPRGLGASSAACVYTPSERAYEVVAAVDTLGLRRVALLGQQDGAEVAMLAADLLPGRADALVLCGADGTAGRAAALAALGSCVDLGHGALATLLLDESRLWAAAEAFCRARDSVPALQGKATAEQSWVSLRMSDPAALRATLRAVAGHTTSVDAAADAAVDAAGRAGLPTLLLRAASDRRSGTAESEALRSRLPAKVRTESRTITDDGGHWSAVASNPQSVASLVGSFLGSLPQTEGASRRDGLSSAALAAQSRRPESALAAELGRLTGAQLQTIARRVGIAASTGGKGNLVSDLLSSLLSHRPFIEAMATPTQPESMHAAMVANQARQQLVAQATARLDDRRRQSNRTLAHDGGVASRAAMELPTARAVSDRLCGQRSTLSRDGISSTPRPPPDGACEAKWATWLTELEQRSTAAAAIRALAASG